VRVPRYQFISLEIERRIAAGEYTAGGLLPSEAGLSREFGVSRVTVRRALELVRDHHLVEARQGLGWYVSADPLRQSLDQLDTIEQQLRAAGVVSQRRVLDFAFTTATPRAQEVLGEERVLEVRRVNLADGQPFARVTVWCPESIGAELSRNDVEVKPFYELIDVELAGAEQTVGAAAASVADAEILGVPAGSPVLVCERITRSLAGDAVLLSEQVYPGHRTVFAVDLPHAAIGGLRGVGAAGAGPARLGGLRLVE